jgi:hypothetical protein
MPSPQRFAVSPNLASALAEFEPYLVADDVERSNQLEASDSETLRTLAAAVEPLFDEINAILDKTGEAASLTDEEQELESNLHSLAQAAIEAGLTLEERGE